MNLHINLVIRAIIALKFYFIIFYKAFIENNSGQKLFRVKDLTRNKASLN